MDGNYEIESENNDYKTVLVYGFDNDMISKTIVEAISESEASKDIRVNMPVLEIDATFGELFTLVQRQLPVIDYKKAFAISKLLMLDSSEGVAFKRKLGLPEMLCNAINNSNLHLLTTVDYVDEVTAEVREKKLSRSPYLDSILKEDSKFIITIDEKIRDFETKKGRKSRGEARGWLDEEYLQWSEVFHNIEASLEESLTSLGIEFDKKVIFSFFKFDKPYSKEEASEFFDDAVISGFPGTKVTDGIAKFERVLHRQMVNSLIIYKQIRRNLGLPMDLNFPALPESLLKMVYPMKTNIETVFRCFIGAKEYFEPILEYSIDLAGKKFEMTNPDFAYWYVANVYYQTLYRDYVVRSLTANKGTKPLDYPMTDNTQSGFLKAVYTDLPTIDVQVLIDTLDKAVNEGWTNEQLLSDLDIRHVKES